MKIRRQKIIVAFFMLHVLIASSPEILADCVSQQRISTNIATILSQVKATFTINTQTIISMFRAHTFSQCKYLDRNEMTTFPMKNNKTVNFNANL